jgi:riboflavin synthase
MFTGLIETSGTIQDLRRSEQSLKIGVMAQCDDFVVSIGASVAINGVCLTLETSSGKNMFFTAVHETLRLTTLLKARPGDKVNLERAVLAGGRLDGHFVLGHVDAVGSIVADKYIGDSIVRTIRIPPELRKFLARKGSVAVDGISLTIADCSEEGIEISLIPRTLATTTMGTKKPGDEVNIECDVLARYIERMINQDTAGAGLGKRVGSLPGASLIDTLERAGF